MKVVKIAKASFAGNGKSPESVTIKVDGWVPVAKRDSAQYYEEQAKAIGDALIEALPAPTLYKLAEYLQPLVAERRSPR